MTRSIIFTVAEGKLTAMTPAAPQNEDSMQRLVADYPEIIADRDGALLLIRREQPIGDGEGHSRWSLDHLFVTREGVPVLVELKRAVDTRLRREVVGQMLDYAANGTAHWKAGVIAASFGATAMAAGRDPDVLLSEFLGTEADPDVFWQQVDANFSAGRIKLVFVADVIPRELARIVEFLNEQMRADVRAIELSWFEGQGIKAFSPRVIGETERAQALKSASAALPALTIEEWIAKHLTAAGKAGLDAAERYCALVADAGGHAEVTIAQGSIIAAFDVAPKTVYPISLTPGGGKGLVQVNFAYLKSRPAFASEDMRQDLYDRMRDIVGPLTTPSLAGFPAFPLIRLNNSGVADGVSELLREIVDRIGSSL